MEGMKPNQIIKSLLLFVILGVGIFSVHAQDVKFTGSATRVVEVGEQFRLSYTLNAKGSDFEEAAMDDFRILSGPNVSTSSSVQIINGSVSKSVSYTYNFVVMASKEGTYTIPPAKVKVNRKTYQSNAINIEVVKGNKQATAQQQSGSQSSTVDKSNIGNDKLFVAVNTSKKHLYQGESFVAEIKVYTKVGLAGFEDIKFPAFNGFWSQDIESPQQISLQRENVNGEIYEVGLFKKVLLFPQRSGEITIEPFEITMITQQRVRSNNAFDDFFGGSYKRTPVSVKSAPVSINVQALPTNKPLEFNGAVGDFKMNANIDKSKIKANEAINLKIRVSGNGNLKLIKPVKVDFPPDLDVYDPKTSVNTKATNAGVEGSITFDYLFIPRFAGNYRIAPIKFSYFDTKTKSYKTLTSQEFEINVERGDGDAELTSGVVQGLSKEDVKFIGEDIRFLKTSVVLKKKEHYIFGQLWFFGIYIGTMVIFVLLLIIRRTQIKQNANQAKLKNRRANKVSKKRLKIAASHMKHNVTEAFYNEILKAIWGYLSDKLAIPVAKLTKDNVSEILIKKQVDDVTITHLKELLDACEFARFAPASVSGGMEEIYKKAGSLISILDQKIK
ncbi:MAG: protein BatD [Salinivirgaceae bacterium]|nr:protein BatD [Salinivirgaceae bacterium]